MGNKMFVLTHMIIVSWPILFAYETVPLNNRVGFTQRRKVQKTIFLIFYVSSQFGSTQAMFQSTIKISVVFVLQ